MDFLLNRIPEVIRDSCDKLYFIQTYHYQDYVETVDSSNAGMMFGTTDGWGGVYNRAYIRCPNIDPPWLDTLTWIPAREYTTTHELAHAYDYRYGYWSESTTHEWDAVHRTEGQLLADHSYGHETYQEYSNYDKRKETYAMATDGYFNHTDWMIEHCPLSYAYMDAQWGEWKAAHVDPAT